MEIRKGLFLLGYMMMASNILAQGLYETSGHNSTFDFSMDTPFHEYVDTTRKMISQARVDLTDENRAYVVSANTPFELSPSEGTVTNGILLVHGLGDSPYQMRDLARHFVARGFLVRTILLPGHGTVPGDLLDVTWEDWVKATKYGLHRLERQVENLYIGGFSTGGELALLMCLNRDDIKGLFLFSPVTGIDTPFAWFSTTVIAPTWLTKIDEKDFARYDSLPSNAVGQVYDLTRVADGLLEEKGHMTVPVFIALSEQDITVDFNKTMTLFNTRFSSPHNRMVVYSCAPDHFPADTSGRITVVDSRIPEERIVSFSHLSIVVSPDEPHYGKNGDYVYRPHPWMRQSEKGVTADQVYYGELMRRFKKEHYIRRLSYNPYFKGMTQMMDGFIAGLSSEK